MFSPVILSAQTGDQFVSDSVEPLQDVQFFLQ
jgi:hypothetical protein